MLLLGLLPGLVCGGTDSSTVTGSIGGEVMITPNLTSQKMRFRIYPTFKSVPPPATSEALDDERRNVVIYLESTPSITAIHHSSDDLKIAQLGETFLPNVLPVVKGSTVEFPNQDPIFHNVFSLSKTKSFDLGRYPKGSSRSVTFDQPGIVPVFCHLHSNMSAIILVLDNPFFAVPGSDGSYLINDIPPGSYKLIAWHQRSKPSEHRVQVVAGQTTELKLLIPIADDREPRR